MTPLELQQHQRREWIATVVVAVLVLLVTWLVMSCEAQPAPCVCPSNADVLEALYADLNHAHDLLDNRLVDHRDEVRAIITRQLGRFEGLLNTTD